jgi:hypothetical protein
MVEFKIQLEERLVQTLGHKEIENSLQEFIQNLIMKRTAHDVLKDLQTINLENDGEWQTSRALAWQQEKHKYEA